MSEASSPASSGPAGGHFEGQVGASYLLAMLVASEPQGLPGTVIDRVEFQRAAEGYPLDDVIVHAHEASGTAVTLQIQVKRDITFAPKDGVFQKVVGQIAKASGAAEFWNGRHELGIAISRSSRKIDGPIQDVLTWARQLEDAKTFFERLERSGSANPDMREFVKTIKNHLGTVGVANDDEIVWKLLRRLQIFVFDFTASGSASEELAKERAARALHPEDCQRAANLWKDLTELAIDIAKSGGDRTRERLIADLRQRSFRLAGDRHNLPARQALADASRNTLADIGDHVAGVRLTRQERVSAVHSALDSGRYVEIRGNAGVGKSGVLKHFAEQISTGAAVIALSPIRTVPRGWLALRTAIGFDGSARDLLSDLAGSGSVVLFVDSLDFFGEEERLTVIDLVREASTVPGMSVVVTARQDFGVAEPNWLPADALDKLGRAEPVVIDELNEGETDELRNAAPQLTALLVESHPARGVARNLYRLSRLANRPTDAPVLRTEAEMAEDWWQSADGLRDQGHRERARVLRAIAEQALSRADRLTVSSIPAAAVDALVESESLRDLGNDHVAFRHDVLREWAIANLLISDPSLVGRLPLDRPAPAGLDRGVELAARMAIERTQDSKAWQSFVESLSKEGTHGSWRRAGLLALVRSEIATELLVRASACLLDYKAGMLRELTRLVMAIDVVSARKRFAGAIDPKLIPEDLNVPNAPSWGRLIVWLLSLGETLPNVAIPDVVDLYTAWCFGALGQDPLTPLLLPWLYRWLMEIENARDVASFRDLRSPFAGELDRDEIGTLEASLRTGFLLFCNRVPELAAQYLASLRNRRYSDREQRGILKFRGTLAQAAPKQLAEFTAELVIPKAEADDDSYRPMREPFGYMDIEFVPASPAQGPFLELLNSAPEHGLPLIRKLVDHAIWFYTGGNDFGADAITVPVLAGGELVFPWVRSYNWSRDMGSGPTVLASALMALEAWAHKRIEAGEPLDKVLADVIGPPNPPAAYLLVAIDLLLSHWPKSREAAIPFLACPELLCLDRQRSIYDNFEYPDIWGLKALQKEPVGPASIDSLKARPSRRLSLEQPLGTFAVDASVENRDQLAELLGQAAARLGPPTEESDLGDAEFMVLHALNLIDPKNWHKAPRENEDWSTISGFQYAPPKEESQHLKPLQEASLVRNADASMEAGLRAALNNPCRSSPDFAAKAAAWAEAAMKTDKEVDDDQRRRRQESIVTAAMIAVRDGGCELIGKHETWIRDTFTSTLKSEHDPVHRMRAGLQFNPIAIAFVGMTLLVKNRFDLEYVRNLLEAAGDDNPAAAHGFATMASTLAAIDERLPRALLRCAFVACPKPRREWDQPEAEYVSRSEIHRQQVRNAIDEELAWLTDKQDECKWPLFPPNQIHSRPRFILGKGREVPVDKPPSPDVYMDHQAAALWLSCAGSLFDVRKRPWLRDIIQAYMVWTKAANGTELNEDEDVDNPPREWNNAYFKLLAYCLPGLKTEEIRIMALEPILGLPDEAFLDVMAMFQRDVDGVYFNDGGLQDVQALHIRSTLAGRLKATRVWQRHTRDRSKSIETHLGPAAAVLLFNDYGHFQPAKCYLYPEGIDRLSPFLPLVKEIAESGTFLLVAFSLLNLLEVATQTVHLPLIIAAGKSWLAGNPNDDTFWIGHDIGRRLCSLVEAVLALDPKPFSPEQSLRMDIDRILADLVRIGVPEAHRLEEALRLVQ